MEFDRVEDIPQEWNVAPVERTGESYTKEFRNRGEGLEIYQYSDKGEPHKVILEEFEENEEGDIIHRDKVRTRTTESEEEAEEIVDLWLEKYKDGIGESEKLDIVKIAKARNLSSMLKTAIRESEDVSNGELQEFQFRSINKIANPKSKCLFKGKVDTYTKTFMFKVNYGTEKLNDEFQDIVLGDLEVCLTEVINDGETN